LESDAAATSHRVPPGIDATEPVLQMFRRYGPRYRWLATATAMIGSFATLLTATIINVAIPDIMGALGMTATNAQWLATGFLATSTVTMLISAWAVETYGISRTFLLAMSIFAAGAVMGGFAVSGDTLILARIVQGAGAGLMSPVSMLIIYQVFPLHRRGTAMGIYAVGIILAPALGPAVGGWLVDQFSWRYVFFMAVPFVMASVPLALLFLPQRDVGARQPRFDWTGVALLGVFLIVLLVLLSNGAAYGWESETVALLGFCTVTTCIAFLFWEWHTRDPLLNLRLFVNPRFLAASMVTFVLGAGLFGSTYVLPLFLQTIQGLTPTDSGVLLIPAGLLMAAIFPIAGRLSDELAPRNLILTGLLIFGISALLFRWADGNTPFTTLVLWIALGRVGLALIFPCLNAAALRPLPLELLAQGAGAINFLRQLGGAFGVNLLTIYLMQRSDVHAHLLASTQTAANPQTITLTEQFGPRLFQMLGAPERAAETAALDMLYHLVIHQGSMLAYRDTFLLVAIVFFLCLIPAWFMDKRPPMAIGRG
jgi:MFS transporter, DHA2 family, multidrug resistance protein